ncbi:MAG: tRNA 4-thiouridine(8) synthase ThiI [Clostridium sp.]|uniref:tRNA uracil 4-sulfurtransferase ThiI n=1 Tax=Clostridium sp. AF28-12 TaxID=2305241 RepID=UPI000E3F809C|nr:tRNA uracil 4-sulfurtransferase ThiI [Clostridium sp. AF28-12]MBS5511462.1 tRNA 4-thiouridine(8) synthase ThiI [Clostridium sp.]RGD99435.1 tRNA 4-thiouridine(8) synthase ThiI [Clostridium sp. AF28-12]RGE01579.1 tRNA 4-thiouridine(8) synthase ThiI [Clostridiaceae bacterium AF02-42]
MKYRSFLIKYAEIGVKGKNRYLFEDALVKQIHHRLKNLEGDFSVTKEAGRIYAEAAEDFDYDEVIDALQHVFGIVGICPMVQIEDNGYEDLKAQVVKYIDDAYENKNFTFKVVARRANKQYPVVSDQINRDLGEVILNAFPETKVNVHTPDVLLRVEVRHKINIFSETIPGPGGMPIGTAGRAMLLLSGGIDSPVAGWMIAKRGVTIDATYFHAPPYTSERAKQKVVDLAKLVAKYTGPIRLNIINFTDIQLYIYDQCPHDELTIIMRRYMMKIAETIAKENDCLALVTGESIGQVASQTMQSLAVTNEVCELPVMRPLIAFDKQDIVDISLKIGTYETSVLPYEDCCTIFVAKHPVTKPSLKKIKNSEKKLDEKIDELMKTALETREVIRCI